jgi:uncharacterized DUF497 family protein
MTKFEWDPKKAASNRKKHRVSFEDAITAFDDPYALIAPDESQSTAVEKREWLVGEAEPGVLVIIFTMRSSRQRVRIISARRANRKERKLYEEAKGIPV